MSWSDPAFPADLQDGFRRFRATRYPRERDRYRHLASEGQHPLAMVVACSDSRVAPDAVFDAGPGELFVVRNVAGLVPVYEPGGGIQATSAALEYAILALDVPSVVVLGHGRCGGIAAALEQAAPLSPDDALGAWVTGLRVLADTLDLEPEDWVDPVRRQRVLELRSVEQSIANLRTFPWVRSREGDGHLGLHGAWFDIGLGELHALTPAGWVLLPDA